MKRLTYLLVLCVLTPLGPSAQEDATLEDQVFVIVINAANGAEELERARISKMFLKRIRSWPDSKLPVTPVDQVDKSSVREAFTRAIYGKRVSAIISIWQRRIFAGRGVPPRKLDTDREVLDFVRRESGAIGYVSSNTMLGDGVKELKVTKEQRDTK